MIFDALLLTFMSFPAIFAVIEEKANVRPEEHLKVGIVLAIVGLILGMMAQFESMVSAAGYTTTLPTLMFSIPGMEQFYFMFAFFYVLIIYIIGVILAKIVKAVEKTLPL